MTAEERKAGAVKLLRMSTEEQAIAFGVLREAARNGDAESAIKVAVCHYLGVGCMQNYKAAVSCAKKQLFTQGSNIAAIAQYIYGTSLLFGRGIDQNDADAVKWLDLSAHVGLRLSKFQLAGCYASGRGVLRNLEKARELVREAALAGDRSAMTHIGQMCLEGIGGPSDGNQAIMWFQRAADAGDPIGMLNFALCCVQGSGVPKDLQKGQALYERVAECGFVPAMCTLAIFFAKHPELPSADTFSKYWLARAWDADEEFADSIIHQTPQREQLENEARFTLEKLHEYNELFQLITQIPAEEKQ